MRKFVRDAATLDNLLRTRRYPVSLVHFVVNRCNARCPFCFIDFDDAASQAQAPTVSEVEKIAKSVGPLLQNVNLTGGEPFLRKDLSDLARAYLSHAGVQSIYVTTNGTYTDRIEQFLRSLSEDFSDRRIVLSFSIDGLPAHHDIIRRVPGLFEKTMESYRCAKNFAPNVMANVGITVSSENYAGVDRLYDTLVNDLGVEAITCTAVRDEGVFSMDNDARANVHKAYSALTKRLSGDIRSGRLSGFDIRSVQGRMMNKKNEIAYGVIRDTLLEGEYRFPCRAAAIFGVIAADGTVFPCEILDKPIGNLRDVDFDFMKLWQSSSAADIRDWIVGTRCNCTYECAMTLNILANIRYLPKMAAAAVGLRSV